MTAAEDTPLEFASAAEAVAWSRLEYGEAWEASLTAAEQEVLRSYKGDEMYGLVNAYLRHGVPPAPLSMVEAEARVATLRSALGRKPLPQAIVTFRGTDLRRVFGDYDPESLPGGEYAELGFVSTSLDRDYAENWDVDLLVITVPPQTPVAWLDGLRDRGECGLLLPAGTKFAIDRYERLDDRHILYLTVAGELDHDYLTTNTKD